MLLPEITERLLSRAKKDRPASMPDEKAATSPRQLSETERGWIKSMLSVSPGWESADLSQTTVVGAEPNAEGVLILLEAPHAENPRSGEVQNSYAQLWIETSDQLIVNVLLFEWKGRLQHLYVAIIDPRHPKRIIDMNPNEWVETARHAVGFGA